ncbi:MAG: bifunctional hydroxymethylpyrimidine kinase/phosphomethylpyrimidine kinase, partial [Leptolyngbya sp.]|nr:bifunctional hydroxymethylpyrimidine kinase/phosphomethylpyrimidine kinase [Candidatus Melainabacteria bacterium]
MKPAIVWTVGGSDSSSGAGVQADILTIDAFSVHACSVIVALTAQSTLGVEAIEPVSQSMISNQMRALASDLPATAVKLGMLYGRQQIETVASALKNVQAKIVLDPVLAATSGDSLSQSDCARYLMSELLPLADLITPNLEESGRLLAAVSKSTSDSLSDVSANDNQVNIDLMIESMGQRFLECGAKAVLIKGGHRQSEFSQDFYTDGNVTFWLTSPRQYLGEIHGSGCAIASAIAAGLAEGLALPDAIVRAKTYLNQCIRDSKALGSGALLLGKEKFDPREEDIPKLTSNAEEGRIKNELDLTRGPLRSQEQSTEATSDAASGGGRFGKTIGAYPIVDRAFWIKRLALCGIKTIQIRIKDLAGEELLAELKQAVSAARECSVDLYINDFWREALLLGASGVHLGQGDLESADRSTIRAS